MKRLYALFTLAALVMSLLLPALAEEIDYEALYAPILASAADLVSRENPDDHILGNGESGIREIRGGLSAEEALWNVGYVLRDISGDSIPELIFAQVEHTEVINSFGKRILAVYTCIGGTPRLILEGWGRNCYYLLPDGSILNRGSSGAAYSCLGIFRLNGTELECLDFFFTDVEDSQIITYHNQEGIWDPIHPGSERVEDDFWRLSEIMEADTELLELTNLYFYLDKSPASVLSGQWYTTGDPEPADTVIVSDTEYSSKIALCAYNGAVTELQLLSLELEDVAEDGTARFKQEILETIPTLEPGKFLVVQLEFGCTIPNFGFRYTDSTGVTRAFSLMQSGMDGSVLMSEIK